MRAVYSGMLCRCHACGIAVCFAADLRIVYSGLLYRCHARRVAACSAVAMRVEWRLIPPPCAWRLVCDCIRLMFLHGVSPCMQFQPQAALRNQDTGVLDRSRHGV